jgi:EAL domain-containing protein (putative c-di-GMP-specific phosphodiesterase class I)
VEALVRWSSATKPGLTAEETIRIAEGHDLISSLDRAVLRQACHDAVLLQQAAGTRLLSLHVNVSGLSLIKSDFLEGVNQVLAETGWPRNRLVLEITESVVDADNKNALRKLAELRAKGIRIAIDDFGTGYSSLSRLQTLPTDELKLHGTFVESISSHGSAMLEAVASLGRALGLPMIAEGVEDRHQAELLAALGYPMAQGYYFGRPMSRDAICEALASMSRRWVNRGHDPDHPSAVG